MFGLGTTELLIVAAIVFILFGTRLPSVMRSLGVGITEFKKGLRGDVPTDETGRIVDNRNDVR